MKALHTIAEIVEATGGQVRDVSAEAVSSVSIDSREIAPGALFVAIKGGNFDGHDFVARAIEAGAAAALVSADRAESMPGLPLIVVPDALEALEALGRYARQRSTARIVAVTGSVGKTSTKEAIRVVLEAAGRSHASIRSFNNHWGVPLMLARMPRDTEYAVFELGMNRPGEISTLTDMVRPHVAVITTIAPAHLEYFGTLDAIAEAKAEIFEGLEPGGVAIVGADNPQTNQLISAATRSGASVLTYGFDATASVRILDYVGGASEGRARLVGDGLDLALSTAAPGRHMLSNAAAAVLVARAIGIAPETAVKTLASHGAPEGRGAAIQLGDPTNPLALIDESYNANPTSMRAALEVFGQQHANGRKILVLGDMLELGEASGALHADLASDVVAAEPDLIFLVGRHMQALGAVLPPQLVAAQAQRADEIAPTLLSALAYGDSVMIKGSNGMKLGALVADIRSRFL